MLTQHYSPSSLSFSSLRTVRRQNTEHRSIAVHIVIVHVVVVVYVVVVHVVIVDDVSAHRCSKDESSLAFGRVVMNMASLNPG